MTPRQKKCLIRILIALCLFAAGFFLDGYFRIACYLLAWALTGYETLLKSAKNIAHGQIFDENFLMSVATVGAFALGEWSEGAAVMIFYQIGELFESYAVTRSRRSISSLMDLRPDDAFVYRGDEVEQVDPEDVQIGDLLRILPGERIPVDGVIVEGQAAIDTSAITGESVPADVEPGSTVLSGCVNLSGVLKVRAQSEYSHSTVARILELVETAAEKKAASERMITKFARYYTPIVVLSAVVLAVLPPLLLAQPFSGWIARALTFLVISCPCALVISVPLSFFGGMGAASKLGVIVKGGAVLERLARLQTIVLDKTGTITTGRFELAHVYAADGDKDALLRYAALAERYSVHPVSQAIRQAAPDVQGSAEDVSDLPGFGVSARIDGAQLLVGNEKLMRKHGVRVDVPDDAATVCYVAKDGALLGWIALADQRKAGMDSFAAQAREQGVKKCVMLTGDHEAAAAATARQTGLDAYYAQLLPQDKVARMEALMAEKPQNTYAAFVGDGVNDAPVLTMADVGVAMGGVGSDAVVEAADLVILNDDPRKLLDAMKIAKKTCAIAKQNIVFAIGVKVLVLILGALGIAAMWMAIFADVGVAVLAILNAMRALRYGENSPENTAGNS